MAMDISSGLMVQDMKVSGKMIRQMAKESLSMLTEMYTRETG
jgi:hypothetical protein